METTTTTNNQTTPAVTDQQNDQPTTAIATANDNKSVTKSEKSEINIAIGIDGLELKTFDDMWRLANVMAASEMVPKDFRGKAANAFIAMQYGMEIGFKPMQAIQSINVINGRPGLGGDAALAKVRSMKLVAFFNKEWIGTPGTDSYGCRVTIERVGMERQSEDFTIGDAKTAKLWGNAGPWTTYWKRQLYYRALGFVLRDNFSDVLKGMVIVEELMDYPVEAVRETATPTNGGRPKFDDEAIAAKVTATVPIDPKPPVEAEEAQYKEVAVPVTVNTATGEIDNNDTRTEDEKRKALGLPPESQVNDEANSLFGK